MQKVKITILKDKYKLTGLGMRRSYSSSGAVVGVLTKKLTSRSCLQPRSKMMVVIKMGKDTINESLASTDPKYLIYCTKCFLEEK